MNNFRAMFNEDVWGACDEDFSLTTEKSYEDYYWLTRECGDFIFTATELYGGRIPDSFEGGLLVNLNFGMDFEHPENACQIVTSWEWDPILDSDETLKEIFQSIELCVHYLEGGK